MNKHKIACYRPWTSYYVETSTQHVKPCCWYKGGLAKIQDNSTLENTFQNEDWQQLRNDMYYANGHLPSGCPIYCQNKQSDPYYEQRLYTEVEKYILSNQIWDHPPVEFSATIANACNLKCKMCWIFDDFDYVINEKGVNQVLDDILKATKNETLEVTKLDLNMSGGEVFYAKAMRSSLYKLINDPNVGQTHTISFITNATIWDQKFWDILEQKPKAISNITISIDGHNKESYANIRGVDSFDKVLRNLDKMIAWRDQHENTHGFWQINVNSIIQSTTYPYLKEIIDLFLHRDVVLSFIPLIIDYRPEGDWHCFTKKEHQIPCLHAIKDAIKYIDSFDFSDDTKWKQRWNQWSIRTSLQRNQEYLEKIIVDNITHR